MSITAIKPQPAITLADITESTCIGPVRVFVYGLTGVGKTHFARGAPAPVFVGWKDEMERVPGLKIFPEPKTWDDICGAVTWLTRESHPYQTFVLDSLSWAEKLCFAHVRPRLSGKGDNLWLKAVECWENLVERLAVLRSKREMNIIFLGHAKQKKFENPLNEGYDKYIVDMYAGSANAIAKWCDFMLFAHDEVRLIKGSGKHLRAENVGAKVLHTKNCGAFDAKSRMHMPDTIPFDWNAFMEAVPDPDRIRKRIEAKLTELGNPAITDKARAAVVQAGDQIDKLLQAENRLNVLLNEKAERTEP